MRKLTKLFVSKASSIDEKAMTAKFKISDAQTDRMGEIVDQKSWNFSNYMENPLLLWGHDPSQPEYVLGQTLSLEYDPKADATFAEVRFDTDINPKAKMVFDQVARGTLRAVSVGMIVHSEDSEKDTTILKDCELLEISVVPIPANPRAIALAYTEGSINKVDAKFMQESMQKELTLLSKELNNDTKGLVMNKISKVKTAIKTKAEAGDMPEEMMSALTDILAGLAEIDNHIDAADEAIDGVLVTLSALLGVDNPDDAETADEDTAEGDDEEVTPPTKAAKIPAKKELANGGTDGDQSGAKDDDKGDEAETEDEETVDENTELTEDQQKAFDQELTKQLAELQVK